MKTILLAVKMFVFLTILTGGIYPLIIHFYAQVFVNEKANGSMITIKSHLIGSSLIGQSFKDVRYFWSRPSATDYNATSSGGSNYGPTSAELKIQQNNRRELLGLISDQTRAKDLLYSSASGLDPHISPESALGQVHRVSVARNLTDAKLQQLIKKYTENRQYGIFGEPRVNVLLLNIALDKLD